MQSEESVLGKMRLVKRWICARGCVRTEQCFSGIRWTWLELDVDATLHAGRNGKQAGLNGTIAVLTVDSGFKRVTMHCTGCRWMIGCWLGRIGG